MLLRNSIFSTKRFFQKTFESVKSFFSAGYQRLPKTPPYNPYAYSAGVGMNAHPNFKDLDKFYTDFTDRWDTHTDKRKKRSKLKDISSPSLPNRASGDLSGSFTKLNKVRPMENNELERRPDVQSHYKVKRESAAVAHLPQRKRKEEGKREGRNWLVAQKLKELEMMDKNNLDHVLDVEEVLHYYSRLTCPAYLDIVDKFFMDIYAEFFGASASPRSVNSRPRLRSLRS